MVIQEGMQIAKMEVVEVEELLLLEKTRVMEILEVVEVVMEDM